MNESPAAEQQQIFEAPQDGAESDAILALIARHKANAALTQQLALDASKLVTTSQQRLAQQSGAGFVKRFASAISGKTGENQLLNQIDMLSMQKFAWHYLQQLQQQNLINAQAIAVIRNNLGTMNENIIETRDFLEQAVDKIDRRLSKLENHNNFNNWALHIEANKRQWKSTPKLLLILRLTYDFMRSHPGVPLSARNADNYLVNTLEKLDINCDEELKLIDFIGELINQIAFPGIDQYRNMIQLSFDEHIVDTAFIQKNISGTGFNALYFLSDQYERIHDLTSDNELCGSDEAREKIISKFFGKEFSGLETSYSVRHLIHEIIGGSQVAIEVYKDQHGLNPAPEETAEEPQPEATVTLVSALPDIHAHTFFDGHHSEESKRGYLLLLALCVENSASLTPPALEFVTLLAEKSGQPGMQRDIVRLADNPRKLNEYQAVMLALLDDDDKKLTWLLDAFFLLTLADRPIENPQVKALLGVLKPARLKECLPHLLAVVGDGDASKVLEAALKLAQATQGWKNVVRYRKLRFGSYFAEALKQLDAASWAGTRLVLNMSEVYQKGMEHACFFSYSDGSFLDNLKEKAAAALCSQGRKSALANLNEFRKKALDFMSEHRSALGYANGVVSRWGIPGFEFQDDIGYADFDLDNSAENEDWGDQFQHCYNQIEHTLNAFDGACGDVRRQIEFFIRGDFDQSVLAHKEQRRAEYQRQQQRERLEKQSVTITKDGKEHLFAIEWERVEHPPCDPEQISHIKTDGKIWLVAASIDSDDVFYRSEDGRNWQQVQVDLPRFKVWLDQIDIVNGVWIIKNRELREGTRKAGIYYSNDALAWRHIEVPGGAQLVHENIMYFKGMWLWAATQDQKYTYVEKGIFSDTTKTGSYNKSVLFYSQTLDGPWQRWDQSPQTPEGVEVKTLRSLPGASALLAFCEYSRSYLSNKKKPETPSFVLYYGAGKSWQTCDWESGTRFYHGGYPPILLQLDGKLMYFSSGEILVSAKGYDWGRHEATLHVDAHFGLAELSLFTASGGSALHLSQDGKQFKEIALDSGSWRHLAASEGGMLGVYYANKHEETMLRFGRYLCQAKT
ncbi:hypothetical protein [Duganella sp. HH105]|uniref:hypothetical protein n=1 Tax=Duganella sp. HH105 TaxID=1781067 RepID=UPI000877E2E2|nr:hypothetical protein [Duganella sp. HH105]OEZ56893.1 hypothetical protein DUGA6_47620 [Duganella sp. HH105]